MRAALFLAAVTLAQGAPLTGATHLVATGDRIVESTDGTETGVPATATADGVDARVPWTCTTSRTFLALAGDERSAPLTVRTPPCAQRLRLASVRTVGLGGNLRVTLIDRWQQGGFAATVCATAPHAGRRCRRVVLGPGQYVMHAVFRTTRPGTWKVTVRDPWHRVSLPDVTVRRQHRDGRPVVLFTGDSMMLEPELYLARVLRRTSRTVDDVYVGSGISTPRVIDWSKLPREQVRAYAPDATVLSLGMDDSGDLGELKCCGDDFVAEYARRARAIMRTYLRGGRGAVVWLNAPLARDPRRWPSENAVDTAVAQAATGLERVRIVDQKAALTPNGYEEYRTVDGTRVRLRTSDGIHLTKRAARAVSQPVLFALRAEFGVVAGR